MTCLVALPKVTSVDTSADCAENVVHSPSPKRWDLMMSRNLDLLAPYRVAGRQDREEAKARQKVRFLQKLGYNVQGCEPQRSPPAGGSHMLKPGIIET